MYEHNALGFWSGLALCLTKVIGSRARCPVTALICIVTAHLYRAFLFAFAKFIRFSHMATKIPLSYISRFHCLIGL